MQKRDLARHHRLGQAHPDDRRMADHRAGIGGQDGNADLFLDQRQYG